MRSLRGGPAAGLLALWRGGQRIWRRRGESIPGCSMCDGLYVRANGALPCWCGPGEAVTLTQVEVKGGALSPAGVVNHPRIQQIRRAFLRGELPFPGVCDTCQATRAVRRRDLTPTRTHLRELHVEPSFLCNLGCAMCPPDNAARRVERGGDMNLSGARWSALLADLAGSGVAAVDLIRFEGKGDPLLHPELEGLVAAARQRWPNAFIVLTTNGSFAPRPALSRCGLDEVVVSADGFYQPSYARYRVRGDLARVKAFVTDLARAPGGPRIVWKYILFEWNDGIEEMTAALRFCASLGVAIEFRLTHSDGASPRWTPERLKLAEQRELAGARVDATYLRQRADAAARGDTPLLTRLGQRQRP